MFENKQFKFEIKSNDQSIFYTGLVVEENELFIKINTKYKETIFLNKKDIVRATEVKRTEGDKQ